MAAPGWYPDPTGVPGQLRYFDGAAWTQQVRQEPSAPGASVPPAGMRTTPPANRRWLWVSAGGVLLLVLALVMVWLFRPGGQVSGSGEQSATPTISAWNETSSASASATRPVACDLPAANRLPDPSIADGRLAVGPISMPVPAGWSGPVSENRVPYGRDAHGFTKTITEETQMGWASSVTIGLTSLDPYPGPKDAARAILQCILTSAFYTGVSVRLAEYATTAVKSGPVSGARADALITFTEPRLKTKGSRLRIIVFDSTPTPCFFFGAVPMENADHLTVLDRTTKGLNVT